MRSLFQNTGVKLMINIYNEIIKMIDELNYQLFEDENSFFTLRLSHNVIFIDRCLHGRVEYFLNVSSDETSDNYFFNLYSTHQSKFREIINLDKNPQNAVSIITEFLKKNANLNLNNANDLTK
jgi:Ni,Fe-hydrogenase maturation factor